MLLKTIMEKGKNWDFSGHRGKYDNLFAVSIE